MRIFADAQSLFPALPAEEKRWRIWRLTLAAFRCDRQTQRFKRRQFQAGFQTQAPVRQPLQVSTVISTRRLF
jgi:hypothetical protein